MPVGTGHKVVFLTRSLNVGGAERQLIELAAGLQRMGWNVVVATFYGGGSLEAMLHAGRVRHVCLHKRGRWDIARFTWGLVGFVRRERPDVVYSMLPMSNVIIALVRPFLGGARCAWGVATSNMNLGFYDWLARVEASLERRLAGRADLIICNSHAGRDCHVARGYPAERAIVIPNGIDTAHFRPDENARLHVRREWGIAAGEKLVALIGRLDPIKDHANFLRAAASVAALRADVRFVCVGEGRPGYRDALVALARDLGISSKLRWAPERPDIWRVYNAVDLVVSSSISEGLTNVAAEAMATGVPCVATDVGDSARLIRNPRWLCPPSDSAALAQAICNALEDLPADRAALRARIETEYALDRLVQNTAAVLGGIMRTSDASARRPKIVFLTRRLDVGGAQRQLVELATGLYANGWEVVVATFYPGGTLIEGLRKAGIRIRSLEKAQRWDVLRFAMRLVRFIRAEKPDVVHGYLDTPNVLLTLLRPLLGGVRLVWGVRASNMDLTQYDRLAMLESRASVVLSRYADLIICNSNAGKAYRMALGYRPEKMTVVPNGVDVTRFRPDSTARDELRGQWNIGAGEVLIGIVARLDPMKDHANFLRAAAIIARERAHTRFVCVGDGPSEYADSMVQEARRLGLEGRVIWVGARDDVHRVYNALDLLVSSSAFGEGFPNTIVEAMATGVPCVVTDVGDSAAIVGDLGWVCEPADSEALSRSIAMALDAAPCDSRAIRERVTSSFDSAMLVARTVARLQPLLAAERTVVSTLDWRRK